MSDIDILQKVKNNPNVSKFLDLLGHLEGTDKLHGYNTLVGGKKFDDLSKHPNVVGLVTKDGPSTAAGRYQIIKPTFEGLRKKYNFTDFSPQTQDLAALALLKEKGALNDLIKGDFTSAIDKVKNVWVSLPGSDTKNQPEKSMREVNKFLGVKSDFSEVRTLNKAADQQPTKTQPEKSMREVNKFLGVKSDFSDIRALNQSVEQQPDWDKIYQAYKSGAMSRRDAREFEAYVHSGKFYKPPNWQVGGAPGKPIEKPVDFNKIYQAYKSGAMSGQDRVEYIAAVKSGSVPAPKEFVASLKSPPREEPGLLSRLGDMFTGNSRKVASTEQLKPLEFMPEMAYIQDDKFSLKGLKVGLGTFFASPEETVKIVKSNYPAVQVMQDEKGNYLAKSSLDDQWYGSKPGFRPTDVPKVLGGVGLGAIAAPTTLLGAIGLGAGTQAAIETTQAASGGSFDLGDVLVSGGTAGLVPAASSLVKTTRNLPGIVRNSQLANTLDTQGVSGIVRGGGTGSLQRLAEEVYPNTPALKAAEVLGVPLNPLDVSSNKAVAANVAAVKTSPSSGLVSRSNDTLRGIRDKTDLLFGELGVSPKSKSTVVEGLASQMKNTHADFVEQVDKVSSEIEKVVKPTEKINPVNVKKYLTNRQLELGGSKNLSELRGVEKKILKAIKNNDGELTFASFEQFRKDIGRASANPNAFPDQDKGFLKNLYSKFLEDQLSFLDDKGLKELSLQQKNLVIERKNFEKNMTSLFGKDLGASFLPQLNTAINDLAKGVPNKFVNILKAVPEDKRTTVAALGLTNIFKETGKGGLQDFANFNSWYKSINADGAARREIRASLPKQVRLQLDNIYRVTNALEQSQKLGKLGAAEAAEALQNSSGIVSRLYELATRIARGNYRGYELPPNTTTPTPGFVNNVLGVLNTVRTPRLKAADKLLASDEFVDLVREAASNSSRGQAVVKFSKTKAFRDFTKSLEVNFKTQSQAQNFVTSLLQTQNRISQQEQE